MNNAAKLTVTGLVALHFLATVWHASAHARLAVTLTLGEQGFVYVVIVLAPIAAALLVWTRRARAGAWVFFLSMLASFLFGVYHHCVAVSADHVGRLPSGSPAARSAFIISAAALASVELIAAVYGALLAKVAGSELKDGRATRRKHH